MLHVLYFAHDLADPAVRRRVLTLQAGGARVTLAGFRRGENALAAIPGIQPIELGRTRDGRFVHRLAVVARTLASLKPGLRRVDKPDVIVGRNLEMLAVANRANSILGGDIPVVYECLDIHRLLLRDDLAGKAIRLAETRQGGKAQLLITSSSAFVDQYFRGLSGLDLPILILENKVLALDRSERKESGRARPPEDGKPWKIGWFGALRCRRSLALLAEFSRKAEGRFEIVLRGRPAYSEFDDFDGFVRNEPFVDFHGSYSNPEDLPDIYQDVQFSWTIDFFEEGQNSSWLLPNRLYEGCLHGAVPIAMAGTETGRFLADRKIGLTLKRAGADDLSDLVGTMDRKRYLDAFNVVAAHDREQWVIDRAECQALVRHLTSLTRASRHHVQTHALSQPQQNEGRMP
jgi:succinoglycan biosynthesis protein ExoL